MSQQASLVRKNIPALAYHKEKRNRQLFLPALLFSTAVYLISLILICLAFCAYLTGTDDPLSQIFIMGMISSSIASFLGSFFLCKKWGQNSFTCALIFIVITLALSLLITLISKNSTEFSKSIISKLPSIISAFFGSFVGKLKKKTSPYDKYKR